MQILNSCGYRYVYNKIYISQNSLFKVELDILQMCLKKDRVKSSY